METLLRQIEKCGEQMVAEKMAAMMEDAELTEKYGKCFQAKCYSEEDQVGRMTSQYLTILALGRDARDDDNGSYHEVLPSFCGQCLHQLSGVCILLSISITSPPPDHSPSPLAPPWKLGRRHSPAPPWCLTGFPQLPPRPSSCTGGAQDSRSCPARMPSSAR